MDDGRGHQLQSLGICHRLYNFLNSLAAYALTIMTSSHLVHHGSARHEPGSKSSRVVHPMARGTPTPPHEAAMGAEFESAEQGNSGEQEKTVSDTSSAPPHIEEKRRLEQETSFSADSSQARAPKKMVSINDNVETIKLSKKKSRKEKLKVDDEPGPLKSILKKVGSDLNNGSDMLTSNA